MNSDNESLTLVFNTLVYIDQLSEKTLKENKTVYDVVKRFDDISTKEKLTVNQDNVINNDEWNALKDYVLSNEEIYDNLTINNIETKNGSKKLTLTDNNNNMYIVFQGTSSGYEWNDNGLGAYSNVIQTPSQKLAVDYFDRMVEKYGEGKNIYVSGHSKGGNESQYVGILRGEQISHVYSFDGQGMNQAVHNQYREEIEKYSGKITNICNEYDFVNILLQPVAGETKYISSNLAPVSFPFSPEDIMKQHSPITLYGYSENKDGTKKISGIGESTSQSGIMANLSGLFKYYEQHMDEKNWQCLCHMIMHLMEMQNERVCYSLDKDRFPGENIDLNKMPDGFVDTVISLTLGYMEKNGTNDRIADTLGLLNLLLFGKSLSGILLRNVFILRLRKKMKDGAAVFDYRVRNFSDDYKQQLLRLVEEVNDEPFWDITKWDVWYRVEDMLGGLNFSEDNKKLNDYYRKIIDINDISSQSICNIFEEVYRIDGDFANKLDGIQASLHSINEMLKQVNNSFV